MDSEVVSPREHRGEVYSWYAFQTLTYASLLFLLAVNAAAGIDRNRSLIVLKLVFIVTSIANTCLLWTGHLFDDYPPDGLCNFNAAAIVAGTPMQASAALALVVQVWSGVYTATTHPSAGLARILGWLGSEIFLLSLPFVFTVPMFLATLVIGRDGKAVRGSPFYCTVDSAVNTVTAILGALLTFIVLILAAWTTVLISRSRRRVRTSRTSRLNFSLVVRTLIFCIFVAVATVVGIISTVTSFANVIPDVVLSTTGVSLFFIFAVNRTVFCFVFCCRRVDTTSSRSGSRLSRSFPGPSIVTTPNAHAHAVKLVVIPPETSREADERSSGEAPSDPSTKHSAKGEGEAGVWANDQKHEDEDEWLAANPVAAVDHGRPRTPEERLVVDVRTRDLDDVERGCGQSVISHMEDQ